MVTRTANSAPLPYLASHATAEEVCPTWASSAAVTYACRSARPHGINRTTPTRRQLTGQLSRARPRPRRNSLNHAPNLTGRGCPGSPSKTYLGEPRRRLAITGPVPLPTLRQYPREQSTAWEPPGEDECHSRNPTQLHPTRCTTPASAAPRRAAATAPCRTLRLNALIREVALHGTALGLAVASRAVLHRRCLLTSAQPSFR